jgi:hypothetical protein
MPGRIPALALGCAALLALRAVAQQPAAPNLQQELQRLGEAAAALDRTLPGFTCEESAVSSELRGGKVHHSVTFIATLRATRAADGKLNESISITQVNGKPFSTGHFALPVFVSGGFDKAMRYFAPEQQACYRYVLSPGRIDFETFSGSPGPPLCKERYLQGFALLNAEGNVTHLERRVAPEAALATHEADYATVDFATVTLNAHTFQLSRHLYAEMPIHNRPTTFAADYTGCKLFTATVTISPGPPPDSGVTPETLPH